MRALSADNSLTINFQQKLIADLFKNWRLTLLGITGVVLSVASGWTTFDGMTNFTGNGVLSLLITFGIQGVMLVTAWLIGESFATGATGEAARNKQSNSTLFDMVKKAFYLSLTASLMFICAWFLARYILQYDTAAFQQTSSENIFSILIVLGSIFAVALCLIIFSNAEIIGPYARGVRIILAHIPLWVMFLCCMTTSVFFSFDSLFSSIFPAQERMRAGELRAQGQVAGLIADLEALIKKRRNELSAKLFVNQSWKNYEKDLGHLVDTVRKAPDAIEDQVVARMKERQAALAQEREKLTGAKSEQSNLTLERQRLIAQKSRLEDQLPKQRSYVEELEDQKRTKTGEIAQKRAIAEAEAKGVGETGRVGRGPIFRQLNKEVTRINIEIQAIDEQLRSASQSLDELENRHIELNAKVVQIDRDIARLSSLEKSARERINLQQELGQISSGVSLDTTGGLKVLEQELNSFRQQPLRQTLINIQQSCVSLIQAVGEIEVLKEKTGDINCNPFESGEITGQVFAMNANLLKYQTICGKEANIPDGTDALLKFGQQCVLISGLTGADTQSFRLLLNRMALNRDDKAHRFVVTWNSFVDGNRLAYLALVIALAIDGLVFMTGLFGANAIVSPLADSPRARNRPVARLEEIVDNALLPDKARAAELMAGVVKPVMDENDTGFVAQIDLENLNHDEDTQIRKILTAGAVLGLIKQEDPSSSVYLVRSELIEYIASVRAHEAKFRIQPVAQPRQEGVVVLAPGKSQSHRITASKPAQKQPVKQFRIVSSGLGSHPRLSDSRTDDERIRASFMTALDLKESALESVDEFNRDIDMGSDEMQLWQDIFREAGSRVPQAIDRTGSRLREKVSETAARLKQEKAANENWMELVEETTEKIYEMLPGIVLYKVYEQSLDNAERAKSDYHQLSETLDTADEDLVRRINNLVDDINDAEQNKFDGWRDLDKYTSELESNLRLLRPFNRVG